MSWGHAASRVEVHCTYQNVHDRESVDCGLQAGARSTLSHTSHGIHTTPSFLGISSRRLSPQTALLKQEISETNQDTLITLVVSASSLEEAPVVGKLEGELLFSITQSHDHLWPGETGAALCGRG